MERGHVLVLGLEGNGVDPRVRGVFRFLLQATLEGCDQKCALRWIALDLPEAILVNQRSVVAEEPGS